MRDNLIAGAMLDALGYAVQIKDGKLELTDGKGEKVAIMPRHNGCYPLRIKLPPREGDAEATTKKRRRMGAARREPDLKVILGHLKQQEEEMNEEGEMGAKGLINTLTFAGGMSEAEKWHKRCAHRDVPEIYAQHPENTEKHKCNTCGDRKGGDITGRDTSPTQPLQDLLVTTFSYDYSAHATGATHCTIVYDKHSEALWPVFTKLQEELPKALITLLDGLTSEYGRQVATVEELLGMDDTRTENEVKEWCQNHGAQYSPGNAEDQADLARLVQEGAEKCLGGARMPAEYWQYATQYFCDTQRRLPREVANASPYNTPTESLESRKTSLRELTTGMRPFGAKVYMLPREAHSQEAIMTTGTMMGYAAHFDKNDLIN